MLINVEVLGVNTDHIWLIIKQLRYHAHKHSNQLWEDILQI